MLVSNKTEVSVAERRGKGEVICKEKRACLDVECRVEMLLVSQQNSLFFLCIHSQRSDSIIVLSAYRQLWYWVRRTCSPISLDWSRGQFQRKLNNAFFLFWCVCISLCSSFPHLFLFLKGHRLQLQLDSFYITLVPSEIILPFILFTASVAEVFVQSDLPRFPCALGIISRWVISVL